MSRLVNALRFALGRPSLSHYEIKPNLSLFRVVGTCKRAVNTAGTWISQTRIHTNTAHERNSPLYKRVNLTLNVNASLAAVVSGC